MLEIIAILIVLKEFLHTSIFTAIDDDDDVIIVDETPPTRPRRGAGRATGKSPTPARTTTQRPQRQQQAQNQTSQLVVSSPVTAGQTLLLPNAQGQYSQYQLVGGTLQPLNTRVKYY